MTYTYQEQDYVDAITRELQKRQNAYPKMLKKLQAQQAGRLKIEHEKSIFEGQVIALETVRNIIESYPKTRFDKGHNFDWFFSELMREYKMRAKLYPRWVFLHRMNEEDATRERFLWREMCIWFIDKFIETDDPEGFFNQSIAPLRRRKSHGTKS